MQPYARAARAVHIGILYLTEKEEKRALQKGEGSDVYYCVYGDVKRMDKKRNKGDGENRRGEKSKFSF